MAFDGIVTRAITNELAEKLENGRITKIYQPTEHDLVINVRNKGKNENLLISIHPNYARVHFTDEKLLNPKEPPMFCMVLRKHLTSGIIEKVEQINLERIIHISIKSHDEIGDVKFKKLIIEIMGRHSHLILVDEERNMIIDSMKHISYAMNRHRAILPGQEYVAPPSQNKLNPLHIDADTFIKKIDFNSGKIDRQILNILMGISPIVSETIANQAYLGDLEKYKEVYTNFQNQIVQNHFKPFIIIGPKEDFHVLEDIEPSLEKHYFNTVSEMLDTFYRGKAERDRVKGLSGDLLRFLKNERDKNIRKLKKHEQILKKASKKDEYQKKGELLTAHLHLVSPGDASVEVIDYYDPDQNTMTIELDPQKSPSQNAQFYYKQYQKLKKSEEIVQIEIEKTKSEIEYFDQLITQLELAREQDVEEIREELIEQGYLKQRKREKKKTKEIQLDYYKATDGTEIIVGRNNKQNEYLTNRLANRNDVWLHTKDIPGSHVIIRSQSPSEETIIEAATIAAFYSKAKQSSTVPVDYTFVKHVRKPKGAKPGYVIYDNQKTVYVTPEANLVEKLKVK